MSHSDYNTIIFNVAVIETAAETHLLHDQYYDIFSTMSQKERLELDPSVRRALSAYFGLSPCSKFIIKSHLPEFHYYKNPEVSLIDLNTSSNKTQIVTPSGNINCCRWVEELYNGNSVFQISSWIENKHCLSLLIPAIKQCLHIEQYSEDDTYLSIIIEDNQIYIIGLDEQISLNDIEYCITEL